MFLKQKRSIQMYVSVLEHWKKCPELTEVVPESELLFKTVSSNLELIRITVSRIEKNISENSHLRMKLREKLCIAAGDLEMLLTENLNILQYNFKKSSAFHVALSATRESLLLSRLQEIHNKGAEKVKELARFGITPCILVQFQEMINSYEKNLESKNSVPMRRLIKELIRETDFILEEIDMLLESIKGPHRKLVSVYKKKRSMPSRTLGNFRNRID